MLIVIGSCTVTYIFNSPIHLQSSWCSGKCSNSHNVHRKQARHHLITTLLIHVIHIFFLLHGKCLRYTGSVMGCDSMEQNVLK